MRLTTLLLSLFFTSQTFAATIGGSLAFRPNSNGNIFIEQPMGGSLQVYNYTGGSLSLLSVTPQTWWSNTGSSAVSVAWSVIALGPGLRTVIGPAAGTGNNGNGQTLGSSFIEFPISAVFHAPSISPAYQWQTSPYGLGTSLVNAGTQTYSFRFLIQTSDGTQTTSQTQTIEVDPLTLPNTQQ